MSGPVPVDLATSLGTLALPAPVLTASGCAAAGRELDNYFDITKLGGIVTKSIMLDARSGRATRRSQTDRYRGGFVAAMAIPYWPFSEAGA